MANESVVTLTITADGSTAVTQMNQIIAKMHNMESETGDVVSTIKSHWLALSAAVYAAYETMQKAWDFAEMAAKYQMLYSGLDNIAAYYKTTADAIIEQIQRITDNTVSKVDIVNTAMHALGKGLTTDQLAGLAQAAVTLEKQGMGEISDVFNELVDSLSAGRMRAVNAMTGVMDLHTKFTDQQLSGMSKLQQAREMYNIIIERTTELEKKQGEVQDENYKRMLQFKTTIEDLKEIIGELILRLAVGLVGALQMVDAGIFTLLGGANELMELYYKADAWIANELGNAEEQKASLAAARQYGEQAKIAMEEATGLYQKSTANISLMVNGEQKAAAAMKPFIDTAQDGKKKTNAMEDAIKAFEAQVAGLNPTLNEYDKRLQSLAESADKLKSKYGDQQRIDDAQQLGEYYIKIGKILKDRADEEAAQQKRWDDMYVARYDLEKELTLVTAGETDKRLIAEDDARKKLEDIALKAYGVSEEYWKKKEELTKLYEDRKLVILEEYRLKRQKDIYEKEAAARKAVEDKSTYSQGEAGDLGTGLTMFQSAAWGVFNQAQGKDAYSQELERLRQFWQEKLNLEKQGRATVDEVNDAHLAYTLEAEQQNNMLRLNAAQNVTQGLLGIMNMLYVASGKNSEALFYMMKAAAVAQAVVNAWLAYTQALASPPGPPWTIPMAEFALGMGLAAAAAIAATAFMGTGAGAGSAGSATATSSPVVTASSPTASTAATSDARAAPVINIHVYGSVLSEDELARMLVPALKKAVSDGAH